MAVAAVDEAGAAVKGVVVEMEAVDAGEAVEAEGEAKDAGVDVMEEVVAAREEVVLVVVDAAVAEEARSIRSTRMPFLRLARL